MQGKRSALITLAACAALSTHLLTVFCCGLQPGHWNGTRRALCTARAVVARGTKSPNTSRHWLTKLLSKSLKAYRSQKAREKFETKKLSFYMADQIFNDDALEFILWKRPRTREELDGVDGFISREHGPDILRLVRENEMLEPNMAREIRAGGLNMSNEIRAREADAERQRRDKYQRRKKKEEAQQDFMTKALSTSLKTYKKQKVAEARWEDFKPYMVFDNRALQDILVKRPTTREELHDVFGLGRKKFRDHGPDILRLVRENELLRSLNNWREAKAKERGLTACELFSDKALEAILKKRPATEEELRNIHGLKSKIGGMGQDILEDILEIVRST